MRCLMAVALAATVFAGSERPAAATAANRSFVYAVYVDFLGTAPTSSELLWFETLLGGSWTRADVVDEVMGLEDFREAYANSVFEQYTTRFPTAAESTLIDGALASGNYLEVELMAFGTAEYSESETGTISNADFVTKIYNDVLWRAPDPTGAAYYENKLATGSTRRQVAGMMIRSSSAAAKRVSGQTPSSCSATELASYADLKAGSYCIILDRPSDPWGAAYWTTALSSGGSQLPALWRSHAASSEYLGHAVARFPSV